MEFETLPNRDMKVGNGLPQGFYSNMGIYRLRRGRNPKPLVGADLWHR